MGSPRWSTPYGSRARCASPHAQPTHDIGPARVVGPSLRDNLAAIDEVEAVDQRDGAPHVLLHQHDRDAVAR